MFDVAPSAVPGNLTCLTDPNEQVLGYFSAIGISRVGHVVDRSNADRVSLPARIARSALGRLALPAHPARKACTERVRSRVFGIFRLVVLDRRCFA